MDATKVQEFDTTQFIVIKMGDEQYGIDIKCIDNIVRMQKMTRVPKMPPYLKGVINLRGEVIPVMSIRIKMDLPEDVITKTTRIIILKLEHHGTIGIMVDEVREVLTLDQSKIEKVSYESRDERSAYISAIGKDNGNLFSLLDLGTVVSENI